jgi:hypothetical protein
MFPIQTEYDITGAPLTLNGARLVRVYNSGHDNANVQIYTNITDNVLVGNFTLAPNQSEIVEKGSLQGILAYNSTVVATQVTRTNYFRGANRNGSLSSGKIPGLVFYVDAASYSSGTTWDDLSGLGNNVTLYGSPPRDSNSGGNLQFNGVNQYGSITNPSLLPSGNQISIILWSSGISATTGHFISGMNSTNRTFNIHLPYSDNRVYWDAGNVAGSYDRMSVDISGPGYTGWHQWVFTKNATSGVMNIYLDNALLATASGKTRTIPVSDFCGLATDNPADPASKWPGYIGKLQIYNRALTVTEVATDFNANRSRFGI